MKLACILPGSDLYQKIKTVSLTNHNGHYRTPIIYTYTYTVHIHMNIHVQSADVVHGVIKIDVQFPDSASESEIGATFHRPGNKFGNEFMYPKFRFYYDFSKIDILKLVIDL